MIGDNKKIEIFNQKEPRLRRAGTKEAQRTPRRENNVSIKIFNFNTLKKTV